MNFNGLKRDHRTILPSHVDYINSSASMKYSIPKITATREENKRKMAVTLFEAIWAQVRHNLTLTDVAFAMLLLFFTRVAIQRLTTKGPMLWPILGIIPTFFVHRDNAYDWVADSTARCGGTFPYRGMWLGRSNGIVTADPAIVEHILKTRFANFPKGRYCRIYKY